MKNPAVGVELPGASCESTMHYIMSNEGFITAVERSDLEAIAVRIDRGGLAPATREHAVRLAVHESDLEVLKIVIRDLDFAGLNADHSLVEDCASPEILACLLDAGLDIQKALDVFIWRENLEMLDVLIEKGVDWQHASFAFGARELRLPRLRAWLEHHALEAQIQCNATGPASVAGLARRVM